MHINYIDRKIFSENLQISLKFNTQTIISTIKKSDV